MCGIGLLIAPVSTQQHDEDGATTLRRAWPSVLENMSKRGPDSLKTIRHDFKTADTNEPWSLSLTASVLSLRGEGVTVQPLPSKNGRLLLAWNGQIFHSDDKDGSSSHATSSRLRLDSGDNDALILLDRIQVLLEEVEARHDGDACQRALNTALSEVEGPYAFVLLDRAESKLHFGRDPLGRRSLLLHRPPNSSTLAIVSVASQEAVSISDALTEIDCSSLWTLDLLSHPTSPQPLPRVTSKFTSTLLLRELRQPSPISTESPRSIEQIEGEFLAVLADSVRRRVTNISTHQKADEAHVAILFSGGLDCTTLALLADRYVPREQPIDLLNVGFENVRAIEAARLERERRKLARVKAAQKQQAKTRSTGQSHGKDWSISTAVDAAQAPGDEDDDEEPDIYAVPDRLTGLSSYSELRTLAPHRRWNFIQINVPYSEYTSHRSTVSMLMSPTSSVMDLSIASALFFASRAQGCLPKGTPYTSPAKVLISGLGADELLGGYSRHRTASLTSRAALIEELQMDLDRLPTRNLGRDDRVLSHHGKEARYPFLDRRVLEFLTQTPVEMKVDLERIGTEGGGGDKRLLRDLAAGLGLKGASELKKRAMQFGTRAAKIDAESRGAKGHHRVR